VALGVFVYAGYQVIQPMLHATAAKAAPAPQSSPNKPASAATAAPGNPAPSASNWVALTLVDFGSVPVESLGARIRQSASWIAQYSAGSPDNEYSVGAGFFDTNGNLWTWTGGDKLKGGASGFDDRVFGDFAA
jgi:hypothetical protein